MLPVITIYNLALLTTPVIICIFATGIHLRPMNGHIFQSIFYKFGQILPQLIIQTNLNMDSENLTSSKHCIVFLLFSFYRK